MRLWARWCLAISPLLLASAWVSGCGNSCGLDPQGDIPCGSSSDSRGAGQGGKSSGGGGETSSAGSLNVTLPGGTSGFGTAGSTSTSAGGTASGGSTSSGEAGATGTSLGGEGGEAGATSSGPSHEAGAAGEPVTR